MNELDKPIRQAFEFLARRNTEIPHDVLMLARHKGIGFKAAESQEEINQRYRAAILAALLLFFDGYEIAARNDFNTATVNAFNDSLELGWQQGGEELPVDTETQQWFDQKLVAELAFVTLLFGMMTQLKREPDFDMTSWIQARADGYTRTLKGVYNTSKMRAMADVMATFEGTDGAESCPDCQRLKGQRHRVSWFVRHDVVPPFGAGLECHPGGHCEHGLYLDTGERITA